MNIDQLPERLRSKFTASDGCWDWHACTDRKGYGRVWFKPDGTTRFAHRVVYHYLVGPVPDDMTIDHVCRNKSCVNPAHLEVVDVVVNVMRGLSSPARNARKTYCKRGHPLDEDNTYVWTGPKGTQRHCITCRRNRKRRYAAERKANAG